jgi:hypothetical protein
MQSASEVEEDQNKQDNKNEGSFDKMLICMTGMPHHHLKVIATSAD